MKKQFLTVKQVVTPYIVFRYISLGEKWQKIDELVGKE